MNPLDFTYYCVYTVIPDKATLGKETGAATLHSSMSSFFYIAIVFWLDFFFENLIGSIEFLQIIYIMIFGGSFVFNWRYFLREKKQKELAEKYGHIKKWQRKLIGVFFLLFCFFFFIFSSITISMLKQQPS